MNGKGRRLQSLVWDMDKNVTDDFQCVWPKEMQLDSCITPVPLVVNHYKQASFRVAICDLAHFPSFTLVTGYDPCFN